MKTAIVFPSRSRPAQCYGSIQSARESADSHDFEFLVRVDWDDPQLPEYTGSLRGQKDVTLVIGDAENGWNSTTKWCEQLAEAAIDCDWVWFSNDDIFIQRAPSIEGWDTQLSRIPKTGFIVQPQFHKLNNSIYENDERTCAPIVPNGCWKTVGQEHLQMPLDSMLPQLLKNNKWSTVFLQGITVFHDRHVDR